MLYNNPTLNAGGPIGSESGAMLRDARKLRRMGFGRAAEQAAAGAIAMRQQERAFGNIGGARKMREFQAGLARAEGTAAGKLGQEQLAGRQAFAGEIRDIAKTDKAAARTYAEENAPKYGVSQSQLATFFGRERLSAPPTAPDGTNTQPTQPDAATALTGGKEGTPATVPFVGPPKPEPTTAEREASVRSRLREDEILVERGKEMPADQWEKIGLGAGGTIWKRKPESVATATNVSGLYATKAKGLLSQTKPAGKIADATNVGGMFSGLTPEQKAAALIKRR